MQYIKAFIFCNNADIFYTLKAMKKLLKVQLRHLKFQNTIKNEGANLEQLPLDGIH